MMIGEGVNRGTSLSQEPLAAYNDGGEGTAQPHMQRPQRISEIGFVTLSITVGNQKGNFGV
jgi:hypothetical protein